MTAPKLDIVDVDYQYQIRWFFPDEDDYGASLGESIYQPSDLTGCERDDRDHVVATITASKTDGVTLRRGYGYYWDSKAKATAALRAVRAAIKADRKSADRPWPDWAVKASAEGWKPPRGWTP